MFAVYHEVWDDQPDYDSWLAEVWQRHCAREEFRLVVARDEGGLGGLVGFGYGYVGRLGQYWPDRVIEALPDHIASVWVDGHFELVSIGVLRAHRGEGVGSRLLDELMADLPSDRALLGTDDDDDSPAVALYRSRGWERLGELAPGVRVMGWRPSR